MVIKFEWSDMDISDKKVLTLTPKHTLGEWFAVTKPGGGVGVIYVIQGPTPTPPTVIRRMLMVQNVIGVMTLNGGFVIIVRDGSRWVGVQPSIESILAVELEGHLDGLDNTSNTG